MTPTFAPASWASIAARIPAQPAPTTRTSCMNSTACPSYTIDASDRGGYGPRQETSGPLDDDGERALLSVAADLEHDRPLTADLGPNRLLGHSRPGAGGEELLVRRQDFQRVR